MLTPNKTLPKKQGHSPVNFQISLFTYKLDFQNKNYIFKIKKHRFLFFALTTQKRRKKAQSHARSACDEASYYLKGFSYLDQTFFWFQNTPTPRQNWKTIQ